MFNIAKLFGRSPFAPLQNHMRQVTTCVGKIRPLFAALEAGDYVLLEKIAEDISKQEYAADIIKNDIRTHLPKTLFLSIDRPALLEILSLQDSIADAAEDVAVLATLRQLKIYDIFKEEFPIFLEKNLAVYAAVAAIIEELTELMENSFGGSEAEKVCNMVQEVAKLEHQADVAQRALLKKLFSCEAELPFTVFHLWNRIFERISGISNLSEKLAFRVRMTLELN